jgi:hypothetical protein
MSRLPDHRDVIEYPAAGPANSAQCASEHLLAGAPRIDKLSCVAVLTPLRTARVTVSEATAVRVISRDASRTPSTLTPFSPRCDSCTAFVAARGPDGYRW